MIAVTKAILIEMAYGRGLRIDIDLKISPHPSLPKRGIQTLSKIKLDSLRIRSL
jgi:hypothetical protein